MRDITVAAILGLAFLMPTLAMAETPKFKPGILPTITLVPPELTGKWRVIEIRNQDAPNTVAVDEDEPKMTISFGDGRFGLSASCNGIQGQIFARDGQHHVVGQMMSTMIACPENKDRQERRLWQAFPEQGHYLRVADYLHLFTADGQLVLTLIPEE